MPTGPRVLLVEDDRDLSALLERLLTGQGYAVTVARDGQQGLHRGLVEQWDLLVVDRGLPGIEGIDLIARLRHRGVTAPVLVLTARDTVADCVEGLDAGAQDYLGKPFDVEELLARLRALLRPRHPEDAPLPLPRGELRLTESRAVVDGQSIDLSAREAQLLAMLARHPRRIFTREGLLDLVFEGAGTPGAVDTYVHYLRRKLGRAAVETVHGIGYRLGSG
ncbi:MAG TPA: response regulator transcription factor [Dermatophilaceae bacterium]|nr:response regulator transcription factor [Dermatophilaceae bacterium]